MLTIPDKATAVANGHVQQAAPDTIDIAALVDALAGLKTVLTGCSPTVSGMGVVLTSGTAIVQSAGNIIFPGATVSIAPNSSGSDRIDLISLYWNGAAIAARVTQGIPAAPGFVPQVPALPSTDTLVARVDVPTSVSGLLAADLLDKRAVTDVAGAGRTMRFTVAASNANATWRAKADYLCDGIADESEILAAIAACVASGGGGVELSDGTFNLSGSVALAAKIALFGQGRLATTLKRVSGTAPIVTYNGADAAHHVYRGLIERLHLDGQGSSGEGIQTHYADTLIVSNVQVDGCLGEGLECVETWDSTFIECRFINCGSTNGTGTPAIGIYQTLAGVPSTDNCNNLGFYRCTAESFVDCGLKVIGSGTGNVIVYRIDFQNCKFESQTGIRGHNIIANYTEKLSFRDCFFFHGPFAAGFSTPSDTIRLTNSLFTTIDGCQFGVNDSVRSLRSFISMFDNVQGAWIANLDLIVGGTNYPTVAGIDNNDASSNNYNNNVLVYDWDFDGHGSSVLFNQGVGMQRMRYNPTVGDRAGPVWAEVSANIWGLLHYQGNTNLAFRDWTHSRNQMEFFQGVDAPSAMTKFYSEVEIDSDFLLLNGVGFGTGTSITIANDTGQDAKLNFKDLNTTLAWTLKKTQGDPKFYFWDRVNNRNQMILTPGASAATALVELTAQLQTYDSIFVVSGAGRNSVLFLQAAAGKYGYVSFGDQASGEKWEIYHQAGASTLSVYDAVNFRDQALFTPGSSSAAALTEFLSKVQIDAQLDMQSNRIVNVADPLNPQDAATKAWTLAQIASGSPTAIDAGPRPLMR